MGSAEVFGTSCALSKAPRVSRWGHGACRGATLRRPRPATIALVLRAAQGTRHRVTRGQISNFSTEQYVVHFWKLHGILRADYGFSLDHEGDDSTARFHVTFGMPF